MVIGFAPKDGHCAVDLLNGHYSYHLVRERHPGKGDLAVSAVIDGFGEAVGTADDEDEVSTGTHLPLQEIGELDIAELASVFIEQQHVHGGGEIAQYRFALGGLDLLFGERFGILEIGQHDELERHIVNEPLTVLVDKRPDTRISRFSVY